MPNLVKQIPETMRKQGIPEDVIAKFDFPQQSGSEDVMELICQMDKLLTKEQRLAVMQEQGCCITGKPAAAHREFGNENKDKTLAEKVALLNETDMIHKAPSRLNSDGTLSVFWGENNTEKRSCPCGFIKKLPDNYEVPLTFCGCCGGHIRSNYQKSLGVNLRLIEIVSSSLSSQGKKRCEFLYKVLDPKFLSPDDIKDSLTDGDKAIADDFITFAEQNGLKPKVKYAPWNNVWKCVYSQKKPKRVIYTIEAAPGKLMVKACLFNIEKYLHKYALPETIKNQLIHERNWNCGNCNETCRKGVRFSMDGQDYYKCIGGAFTLGPLDAADWKQVCELIKEEMTAGGTHE